MAKFCLLASALFVAAVSGRRMDSQNQFGAPNNGRPQGSGYPEKPQEFGGFEGPKGPGRAEVVPEGSAFQGKPQGIGGFETRGPQGQMGSVGFGGFGLQGPEGGAHQGRPQGIGGFESREGPQGHMKHGGHGGRGPHGPAGPGHQLPPFLANVSQEALEEFHTIISNEELTKAELETQLENWAAAQGEEILKAFKETREKHKAMEDEKSQKSAEIVQNALIVMEKIETIKNDLTLTRKQEREQMSVVFEATPRAVLEVVRAIDHAAMMNSMVTPEPPTGVPPMERPSMSKGFGFGGM